MGASDDVLDLLAERAITRVLYRYARAVDTLDLDTVAACYWPDGHDRHADFDGTVPEYVAWLGEVLPPLRGITHQFTNVLIDLDPGRSSATSEAYCLNVLTLAGTDGADHLSTSCLLYQDRWEQRGGEWRVADRHCSRLWTQPTTPGPR